MGRGGRKFLCFEAISSSGFKCGTIRIKVSAREGEKGACFERLSLSRKRNLVRSRGEEKELNLNEQ